jgi:hypothetical protein
MANETPIVISNEGACQMTKKIERVFALVGDGIFPLAGSALPQSFSSACQQSRSSVLDRPGMSAGAGRLGRE